MFTQASGCREMRAPKKKRTRWTTVSSCFSSLSCVVVFSRYIITGFFHRFQKSSDGTSGIKDSLVVVNEDDNQGGVVGLLETSSAIGLPHRHLTRVTGRADSPSPQRLRMLGTKRIMRCVSSILPGTLRTPFHSVFILGVAF